MSNLRFFRLGRWRSGWLAAGVAAGSILLLLALIPSLAQASPVSSRASLPADGGPALVSNGPVITIGVAAALNIPGLGWPELNSAQLAISRTNAAGGVNIGGITYTLVLTYADGQCNSAGGAAAANALLNAGAIVVVGHSCSVESFAAQPIYSAQGVAMVSPSSTNPGVTEGGYTNTFRTVSRDDTGANLLATHFRNRLSRTSSAIVESWWLAPGNAYSDTFVALGGTITSRRAVTDTSEFTATLTAIQAENPDVIVNIFMGSDANTTARAGGEFSRIADDLGMTNVIVGLGADIGSELQLVEYVNAAGAAAEGDFAVLYQRRIADMPGWPTFLADYQAAGFANEPTDPGVFGPYAYDAAHIIIAAIDRANSTDPAAIRDEIAATSNYAGVVGTYVGFDAKGDVIPQWSTMWRYLSGEWLKVYPFEVFLPLVVRSYP